MKRFTLGLALLGAMGFVVAVVLTVTDILLRNVSDATVPGLTDIVALCTMVGSMLAIPYGFAADEHVSVDVFTIRMPAPVQRALRILAALLGFLFLAGVFVFSCKQALLVYGYGDRSQSIGIPMIWAWLPLLIGVGMSAVVNLWLVARLVRGPGRR